MKHLLLSATALLIASHALVAQTPQAYDRLSKDNVSMKAETVSSGAALTGTSSGPIMSNPSTTRNYTSSREVVITFPLLKDSAGMTIQAFGVIREGKSTRFEPATVTPGPGGEYRFTLSAERSLTREKFTQTVTGPQGSYSQTVDTGRVTASGEKISGWFARAIRDNKIVAVAGSSSQMEELAGLPNPTAVKK